VRRTLLSLLAALLTVGAAVAVVTHSAAPARSATAPVRIMPLGDSITGSPGCWRALLWNKLQAGGYTNIDFVGSLPPQGCGVAYDGDNEGHGGILATNMANQSQLPAWLSATLPDIVLMHLGTNDVWSNIAPAAILAAFTTLVGQMRASNPNMKVLVAQIIPMNPSSCTECAARVVAFNAAIPAWAAGITTAASPVKVVDQWTGFDDATDTGDGVHPNDAGNVKISDRWYPPLTALLSGASTSPTASTSASPSASASVSVSPSRSVSPSPSGGAGGCTAAYSIVGSWPGGFQALVTVTNGAQARTSWTARFTLASGQSITQYWMANVTISGSAVTATNMSWNGTLAPGGTATFGFLGTWSGTNPVPTVSCT